MCVCVYTLRCTHECAWAHLCFFTTKLALLIRSFSAGCFRVDHVGGKKVFLLENVQKNEALHQPTESTNHKPCAGRGRPGGVSMLFEAAVGANPGKCGFGGVADGSRTKGTRRGPGTDTHRSAHGCLAEDRARCQEVWIQKGRTEAKTGDMCR